MRVHGISRYRFETDGKGVTDLISMDGCPLSCEFCINKDILNKSTVQEISARDLLKNVMQEFCYFVATGGGITFGGGEPLLQHREIKAFAKIKPKGMALNIETSLQADGLAIAELIPYVDMWIIDIKSLEKATYEKYTNGNFDTMLGNLMLLSATVPEKCLLRIPIIKGHKTGREAEREMNMLRGIGFTNFDLFEYST